MSTRLGSLAIACLALTATACGGGDHERKSDRTPDAAPVRGTLIESPPARTASLSPSNLLSALGSVPLAQQLLELIAPPKCGIDIHSLRYNTVDSKDAAT